MVSLLAALGTFSAGVGSVGLDDVAFGESDLALQVVDVLRQVALDNATIVQHLHEVVRDCRLVLVDI